MSKQSTCTHFGFAVGMVAVVVGLVLVIHTTVQGIVGGHAADADMGAEAIVARIAPVGKLNTGTAIMPVAAAAASAAPAATRSGADVYKSSCSACHASGAAGSPKFGDKAAWSPRIKQGLDTLVSHAINGIRAMPPRGTCATCSDKELKGAVEYMVNGSK